MNIDLTALTAWLSSLGPWGIVLGAALAVLGPKILDAIKKKLPAAAAGPAAIADPLGPTTASHPIIDSTLALLRQMLVARNPGKDSTQLLADHLTGQVYQLLTVPASPAVELKK